MGCLPGESRCFTDRIQYAKISPCDKRLPVGLFMTVIVINALGQRYRDITAGNHVTTTDSLHIKI